MSLKGKNLEGIGNNGIETNTQESQKNTSNIGKNKVVAGLVLGVLLGGCTLSNGTNTLDVKVPKGKDSNKSNPSSQKATGQEQAREALAKKGIVIPKSGESKQDPNELVINLSGDKGLGNIGEVNQEKEGNPLKTDAGIVSTNRGTGLEASFRNDNFLVKTKILENIKAIQATLGGDIAGNVYWKVTGGWRTDEIKGKPVGQRTVGGELGLKSEDNTNVGIYASNIHTDDRVLSGVKTEEFSRWEKTTKETIEKYKGSDLNSFGISFGKKGIDYSVNTGVGPTYFNGKPGIGSQLDLIYNLTDSTSLYLNSGVSQTLDSSNTLLYVISGISQKVTELLSINLSFLYTKSGNLEREIGGMASIVYTFGGSDEQEKSTKSVGIIPSKIIGNGITSVKSSDMGYYVTIGQIEKKEEVSIENRMVPINLNYDANGLIKTLSLDLSTLYPTIGSNLEIVSYNINKEWPGNLVLNGTPTISGKTLNADSIGGGHVGPFSLEIKDKDTNQTYKLLVNNYGI